MVFLLIGLQACEKDEVIKLTVDDVITYNIYVSKGLYIYDEALTQINVLNVDTYKNITFKLGIYYLY